MRKIQDDHHFVSENSSTHAHGCEQHACDAALTARPVAIHQHQV